MSKIKDSGERRKFESGAVRDMAEGKGRCDLLPLFEVADLLPLYGYNKDILEYIHLYMVTGDTSNIYRAMVEFISQIHWSPMLAILEVSIQYEDGAKKYAERNWEKGIPLHCYVDSGVRHYLKYLRGDTDEPHDRAFLWNMFGLLWTHRNRPEMIDLPFSEVL
jgi:hypothetical protein